jgi:hypothetical protein
MTFPDDEIYFVSIIANFPLTAIKLRGKLPSASAQGAESELKPA